MVYVFVQKCLFCVARAKQEVCISDSSNGQCPGHPWPGMLKSRDRSRSRDVSRPLFDGLGLGLGLEGSGLGLEVSGLGLKKH